MMEISPCNPAAWLLTSAVLLIVIGTALAGTSTWRRACRVLGRASASANVAAEAGSQHCMSSLLWHRVQHEACTNAHVNQPGIAQSSAAADIVTTAS